MVRSDKLAHGEKPEDASAPSGGWTQLFPPEYWELVELTTMLCPYAALRKYRKSVVGRGRPLTAGGADAAIRAAYLQSFGTDKKAEIEKLVRAGTVSDLPNSTAERIARSRWYHDCGWTSVFVRRQGDEWPPEIQDRILVLATPEVHAPISLLEFDDEQVYRLPVPGRTL